MNWKPVILALIFMLFTTACVGKEKAEGNEKKVDSHIQTYVKESRYPNMEIETEIGEYDEYKYAIHFPRTKQDEINTKIKSFIDQQKQDFFNQAKKIKPKNNDFSELLLDYDITHLSDTLVSIVFTNNQNIAKKESKETKYTLNFDLNSGKQIISNDTEILSNTTTNENKSSVLAPAGKYVAITFDDGPHDKLTPYILDVLKKHKAKATFYVLGNRVEYYPEIVKRAFDEGHEIGNHSWSHPKLTNLTPQELRKQIYQTSSAVAKITGTAPATIRPPYGAFNDNVKQILNRPIVNWSVDTLDWKHKNKEMVKKIVRQNTRNGSIILMHDIHTSTAQALDSILTELSSKGYQFVTVSQLLEIEDNANSVAGKVFMNKPTS